MHVTIIYFQKQHYQSDWHRYNLKQRLKGDNSITAEEFEAKSECVSSISGSESESEDSELDSVSADKPQSKPMNIPSRRLRQEVDGESSNDSETDISASVKDEMARKYPKVYFENGDGEVISLYRCVIYHKKSQPSNHSELISLAKDVPSHMNWAVFMASGGHFAGVVFKKNEIVVQKTFHRYVVRAKRGSAQSSRDSQGNAPKSAGASLRRYNEAALKEDIQELITSWESHLSKCDLIFLRAPGFNKKIFFSGKTPPFKKDDTRIRMIPFPTKRPTHNEVRRVHEMLSSVECYGDESYIQDNLPMSPPVTFSAETGHLELLPEDVQTSPQRKIRDKSKFGTSPLASSSNQNDSKEVKIKDNVDDIKLKVVSKGQQISLIDSLVQNDSLTNSSAASTASESELVMEFETFSTSDLKEFGGSKKPKRKKKQNKKRKTSIKHQTEPESDTLAEERYHLKNSLYTACKVGDLDSLKNLLAIFSVEDQSETGSNHVSRDKSDGVSVSSSIRSSSCQACDMSLSIQSDNVSCVTQEASVSTKSDNTDDGDHTKTNCIHSTNLSQKENTKSDDVISSYTSPDLVIDQAKGDVSCDKNADHSKEDNDSSGAVGSGDFKENNTDLNVNSKVEIPVEDRLSKVEKSNLKLNFGSEQSSPRRSRSSLSYELMSPLVTLDMLNEPIGDSEITLLHVAAKSGHKQIVKKLLENGADPAKKDKYGKPPYCAATEKETRNEFRRFMARYPDKYDYVTAQVPSPLTAEMESEKKKKEAERKKVQKKAKQEKMKEQREEEEKRQEEEAEKRRFLSLSDREKRALAAERRLLQRKEEDGQDRPVLSRCFQCASDMTGKTPFEYYEYKFCSSKCLQQHRKMSANR
ncbi:hypothetical protein KUTeg_008099 [Tegillarca granosa]|uniref:VLRF1 domain-containing protein n=1 Tax=Tegillarca granosa TaxID=220873 RepID=A0ABQ9F854_TEGGR|nr:hypothetical protein KUTeg_008099 [Tegillarca granosa]